MRELLSGNNRVAQIVQKKSLNPETRYRRSNFVVDCMVGGVILLKNTLTNQVYELSEKEWDSFCKADLSYAHVRELAQNRFLVESDYDELAQYELVRNALRTLEKTKPGIRRYTILPTTACNARCVYCYEESWRSVSMTKETADAVIDFICRTKQDGRIRLTWFGGEPLLAPKTISYICSVLQSRDIDYDSSTVTNGTLLTPEMAKEAVELWRLKRVQVSMDGAREDYEARKRYVHPERDNYEKAMESIAMLSDTGVEISIRCNYDAENISRVREFLDDCKDRFGERKNVSIYLAQLYPSGEEDNMAGALDEQEKTLEHFNELGFVERSRSANRLRTHYCMSDSKGKTVVIDPKGGLHFCEHVAEGTAFGTVFDQNPPRFPAISDEIAEECRSCPYLPQCTPFRKSNCPVKNAFCRREMNLSTVREMLALHRKQTWTEEAEENEPINC
ncbi:MAG: radical SAM protein [Clostridia bacterium]|nr:radical SAM protein [Clostridia bacterium]